MVAQWTSKAGAVSLVGIYPKLSRIACMMSGIRPSVVSKYICQLNCLMTTLY